MLLAEEISTPGDVILFTGGIIAVIFSLAVVGMVIWFLVETDEDEDQVIVLGFRIWLLGVVGIMCVAHLVLLFAYAPTVGK